MSSQDVVMSEIFCIWWWYIGNGKCDVLRNVMSISQCNVHLAVGVFSAIENVYDDFRPNAPHNGGE